MDKQPRKLCQGIGDKSEKYLALLADTRFQFTKKKAHNPFVGEYTPDMYETPVLDHKQTSWYQSLIGMLRRIVEIYRVDIITKVLMMAS